MMQMQLIDDTYVIKSQRSGRELSVIRALPTRSFIASESVWHAPYIIENHQHLIDGGYPPEEYGIDRPNVSGFMIGTHRTLFKIAVPFSSANLCKAIPEYRHWAPAQRAWVCKNTRRNIEYLVATFPDVEWTKEAVEWRDVAMDLAARAEEQRADKATTMAADDVEIRDYKWGDIKPFIHQKKAFALSRDVPNFALLMQQGTGKTKVVIDTACWQYIRSQIDGVLIVCPNSVKAVWEEEIELHTPGYIEVKVMVYSSGLKKAGRDALDMMLTLPSDKLDYLMMNVEAFSSKKGTDIAERFLKSHRTLMCVDESTRIKTPGAKRTKAIIRLSPLAKMRRILTGTPVTNGPLDVFAPFKFLDPHILGFGSFYAFRNHFAIMGGWNGKEVLDYANLDELTALLDPHSFRVLRKDCLDLPPKVYQKQLIKMTPTQQKLYDHMRDDMVAELNELESVTVTMVLVQLLRLQQLAGGFIGGVTKLKKDEETDAIWRSHDIEETYSKAIEGGNPKVNALLELGEDVPGKMIVWSRFRAEITLIVQALRKKFGDDAVVEFHGGRTTDERTTARKRFQDENNPARFFVGNQAAGGLGITLTAAETVIYFSNSFSLEERLQSEDRSHRIGQENTVTYIDLIMEDTVDPKICGTLRDKQNLANAITGDAWEEWI